MHLTFTPMFWVSESKQTNKKCKPYCRNTHSIATIASLFDAIVSTHVCIARSANKLSYTIMKRKKMRTVLNLLWLHVSDHWFWLWFHDCSCDLDLFVVQYSTSTVGNVFTIQIGSLVDEIICVRKSETYSPVSIIDMLTSTAVCKCAKCGEFDLTVHSCIYISPMKYIVYYISHLANLIHFQEWLAFFWRFQFVCTSNDHRLYLCDQKVRFIADCYLCLFWQSVDQTDKRLTHT